MAAQRPAARILLLDPAARMLLFRFDPDDRPPFWCTPGGALDPGESYEAAARRELLEETGIDADCGRRCSAGWSSSPRSRAFRSSPTSAISWSAPTRREIDTGGHTELERRVMKKLALVRRERRSCGHDEAIFPEDLIAILDALETADA